MRILHTSDWHLGRTLHGHSRAAEHEAFLDEVVEIAQDVDLVVLSGDVFETPNPPIDAEELFFDALARLGDGGRRAVVVIAGNHDSPDRLTASVPLASRHGVWILGRPGDLPEIPRHPPGPDRVVLANRGPSLLVLDLPNGERAVVAALPYPSEARLRQLLSIPLDDTDRQRAYNTRIARAFESLAAHFEPDAVNLATSHLAVRSCMPSSSERVLIGGAYQIEGSALPAAAQYVALGHLHLPQQVPDAPGIARYAGAPFAMRFSERDDPRIHTLVEVAPGGQAQVHEQPVSAGRPLVSWEAASIEEVQTRVAAGDHADAFIDLRVKVDAHLTHKQINTLKTLPRDFVRIQAELPEAQVASLGPDVRRRDLPVDELFRAFYRDQTGDEPDAGLVDLFVEIADVALPHPADQPQREAG